ncbi:ATP-binding protein [Pseudooceanicola sp.]|uniref:ATP-binding protein n=1 Tax=Pseudooceanicola sp. TaxID=1914328 RepID=UPI00351763C6
MTSIRTRLFVILLLATGAIWFSAVWWIQHSTRVQVERVLDARLAEAAQMVSSLLSDGRVELASAAEAVDAPANLTRPKYSRQLSCQIWSLDGAMIGASGSAPAGRLAEMQGGLSENVVDGERWRVHTEVNEELGLRVMVGDRLTVREKLVADVTRGLLVPVLAILPVLAGLIWLSVGRGLAPLDRMARALTERSADNLEPVDAGPLPRELRPMGTALNALFGRVAAARNRERSFSAYAAHELKTPLSGIKTQAQIAAIAPDEETRRRALTQIERGVARTDRMVRQLLELAAVDTVANESGERLDLRDVACSVGETLERVAYAKGVTIRIDLPREIPAVSGSAVTATMAVRNVVENAIAASPENGDIRIHAAATADVVRLSIKDEGPGIADTDRPRITERFFRGSGAPEGGSGLGLAIAEAAMTQMGGTVKFRRRRTVGEEVILIFVRKDL